METYEEWCAKNTNIKKLAKKMESSAPEQYLGFFLSKIFDDIECQKKFPKLGQKTFDIYIESINLAIEYDGVAFHSNENESESDNVKLSQNNNDKQKTKFCVENKINIVRIRENGCAPIRKIKGQDLIKNKIIKYSNKNNSYLDIGKPIRELIQWINEEFSLSLSCIDVDIEKDSDEILKYVQEKYHKKSIASLAPDILTFWSCENSKEKNPFDLFLNSYSVILECPFCKKIDRISESTKQKIEKNELCNCEKYKLQKTKK